MTDKNAAELGAISEVFSSAIRLFVTAIGVNWERWVSKMLMMSNHMTEVMCLRSLRSWHVHLQVSCLGLPYHTIPTICAQELFLNLCLKKEKESRS